MAGKRFTRGVSRGARRLTSWADIPITQASFTAVGGTILLALTTAEKAKRPFTIVRTHIELMIATDQLIADEIQLGAFGGCVVSDQASGVGVLAVPTPVVDAGSDLWFLHQVVMNDFTWNSEIGFDANGGQHYHLDSRAMRKVNDDQDVLFIGELAAASQGFLMTVGGRLLIKES